MPMLQLDLCPYTVDMCTDGIRIIKVGGSVLAKLDNRVETTGNRFSADRCCTKIGSSWCTIEYVVADALECLHIEPMRGHGVPTFDELVEWLSINYDRIDSIGWEMLERSS